MKGIKITSYGHSCFGIEAEGRSIIIDPYQDQSVPGLPALRLTADDVLCSHNHLDHNNRAAVTLTGETPWTVFHLQTLTCPHDHHNGTKRGMNSIHILEYGGMRIAHFGDIGAMLPQEQLAKLTELDAALIPVGGYYTIDGTEAHELADKISPNVIIPMHYRTETEGLTEISSPEKFLQYYDNVKRYPEHFIIITKETEKQIALLR